MLTSDKISTSLFHMKGTYRQLLIHQLRSALATLESPRFPNEDEPTIMMEVGDSEFEYDEETLNKKVDID